MLVHPVKSSRQSRGRALDGLLNLLNAHDQQEQEDHREVQMQANGDTAESNPPPNQDLDPIRASVGLQMSTGPSRTGTSRKRRWCAREQ